MFKNYFILLLAMIMVANISSAQTKVRKKTKSKTKIEKAGAKKSKEIEWLTWEEAQKRMAIKPKKVYVDVYTDWCGWCKVMDKKTFGNPNVIQYMNENFYAIKFNSEKDDNIVFNGKVYALENGTNTLAKQLMKDKMMYPTSIIFEENFANPQPVPGYLKIEDIQPILTYLAENQFKTISYEDYKKNFKITW
jgi:thioredoxin-related protein